MPPYGDSGKTKLRKIMFKTKWFQIQGNEVLTTR